jgi:hypothetical protein
MNTVYLRRGEFRICPRCSARQKGLQQKCDRCGAALDSARIASRAYAPTPGPHPIRSNRGLRAMLVLAVLGAVFTGIVLRNTFSGAAFDDAAVASEDKSRATAHAEVVAPDPTIYERNAPLPTPAAPEGWYRLGAGSAPPPPPTLVEPGANTVDPASVGGMVGITPGSSGLGRRALSGGTLTNDDLNRIRAASLAPPATPAPPDDRALVDQQRKRDAENALQDAQHRVETLSREAETLRALAASVTDTEAQQEQQRRLKAVLDDLEAAQKDVARAERKLREG